MKGRRDALRLSLMASAFALGGSGKARAADSLSIGPDGVNIDNLQVDNLQVEKGLTINCDAVLKKSLTIDGAATLRNSLTVSGADEAKSLRVSPITAGANLLDVQSAARTGVHPTGLTLYVTANSDPNGKGVEFRHSNGSQGIGIGYNTIYATGSSADQDLILMARGSGRVKITGTLEANDFAATDANPLRHRMYPEGPIVYQDIFEAKEAKAIVKIGTPDYDDKSYSTNKYGARRLIKFGGNNEANGNGAQVEIPLGYNTVWLRILGDRWNVIHAYFTDGGGDLGLWTGGRRSANSYAPDGTLTNGFSVLHQWMPIPARRHGTLALISKPNTNDAFWISGLAFSKNPWRHAAQSAIGYHWAVNGGNPTGWGQDNWNGDTLANIGAGNGVLKVPVVPSGHDKLLYLIEHNSDWNGAMHTGITVGGRQIERFMASYDNPFSRHWNSKSFERYIAARIPKGYVSADARQLDVIIDMSLQDVAINFREIGTHDLAVPWPD